MRDTQEQSHESSLVARRSSLVALAFVLLSLCVAPASAYLTLIANPGAGPQTPADQTWTGRVGHGIGYYIIYGPPPAEWKLYIPYEDPSLPSEERETLNAHMNDNSVGSVQTVNGDVAAAS